MDNRADSSETLRNKCAACFRQFNKMEHLVEHMRVSFHSVHEPKCGVCQKHCRSLESLREHLIGPLPKIECSKVFSIRGCNLCLNIFDSQTALRYHRSYCQMSRATSGLINQMSSLSLQSSIDFDARAHGAKVVSLGCKMVGGGSDGTLDLCARVCLVDEEENVIFHSYIKPQIPVTNYRYETTGIRPEHLRDAMPLKQAQRKIQDFLCNGEAIWKIRSRGGKARILVGHGLDHDLECLGIDYPSLLIRDTANYPPLMKTSKLSNSLKYLTQAYLGSHRLTVSTLNIYQPLIELSCLGIEPYSWRQHTSGPGTMSSGDKERLGRDINKYEIQNGIQDPYEDCVAARRLYVRMRSLPHPRDYSSGSGEAQIRNNFTSWRQSQLERMTPDALLEISISDYYCWCLDS